MKKLCLFFSLAILLGACSRSDNRVAPPVDPPEHGAAEAAKPLPSATTLPADDLRYIPSRDRVLMHSDADPVETSWISLGMDIPTILPKISYGLLIAESPLLDGNRNPRGESLPRGGHVKVLEAGQWEAAAGEYRRLYRLEKGFVDSAGLALILAEAGGCSVGFIPRKIAVSRGESEYSLLAIIDSSRTTLVDTSSFVFPDSFHPSGPLRLSIEDANADGLPEIVLEAETIVSFHYLGATPLRWVAWLRPKAGTWAPVLLYNERFATDEGYSYDATARAFATRGSGFFDTVKVTTAFVNAAPSGEFRTSVNSFFVWDGTAYRRNAEAELPRQGTVTSDDAAIYRKPDTGSEVVQTLRAGDPLYVYDRSDTRQTEDDPASWWYRVSTKSGSEGWTSGTHLKLSWIDPLKVNREVFQAH